AANTTSSEARLFRNRFSLQRKTCHRLSGQKARGPGGLEIEPTGDAVDIQDFSRKKQAGTKSALQSSEINFAQPHATAGDKLVFVGALSAHRKNTRGELLDQSADRRIR